MTNGDRGLLMGLEGGGDPSAISISFRKSKRTEVTHRSTLSEKHLAVYFPRRRR